MAEEKEEVQDWLGCPSSVKARLPEKIKSAVQYALDECFIEMVGEPAAQRDQWLYKEIKAKICTAMHKWIEDAMHDAIEEALE